MAHTIDNLTTTANMLDNLRSVLSDIQDEVARLVQTASGKDELKLACQGMIDWLDGKMVNHSALPSVFCSFLKLLATFFPPLAPFIAMLCP